MTIIPLIQQYDVQSWFSWPRCARLQECGEAQFAVAPNRIWKSMRRCACREHEENIQPSPDSSQDIKRLSPVINMSIKLFWGPNSPPVNLSLKKFHQ